MARQLEPAFPRVCRQCGAAWIQRDAGPPREYCTTSCRQEAERQARGVSPAIPDTAIESPPRSYVRRVRAHVHTITCAWRGAVVTVEQYPGPPPRYCGPVCRAEVAREGAAARMRQMRARRKMSAESVTGTEIS
jgi:hypothetical protein